MTQEYKLPSAQPIPSTLPFSTVLVADDNYASRIIIKTLLEREGCVVSLAHNGRIATQLSELGTFDLILMDLQMPILDGLEASKRIRQKCPNNPTTPIFAITAYSDPDIMTAVTDAGLDALLLKPFRMEDIISTWQTSYQSSTTPHHIISYHKSHSQCGFTSRQHGFVRPYNFKTIVYGGPGLDLNAAR